METFPIVFRMITFIITTEVLAPEIIEINKNNTSEQKNKKIPTALTKSDAPAYSIRSFL
jgi:p-aminobenzoyl-glutamate transporter AbgT